MKTTPEENKKLVFMAFDTLFNKRDYEAAKRYWSPTYIQHSAHIEPGRDGLFSLVRSLPRSLKYEHDLIVAEGDYVISHGRFSGRGSPVNWIAADIVRIEDGLLQEHWDVLQDEATEEQSKSKRRCSGQVFQNELELLDISNLNWEVFVTPSIPVVTRDRPVGIRETFFQAMASTLIYGDKDAVLADAYMTTKQVNTLADWVASKGKSLTAIYITHGHGDHWFGTGTLLERFPRARGDAAYNDVDLYLAESDSQKRQEWIAALHKIDSLNPRAVVASHKRPENDDNPKIIEETRQYIRDFDRLAETTKTAQELYDKMLGLYPNRVNPGLALWSSARAVKPSSQTAEKSK